MSPTFRQAVSNVALIADVHTDLGAGRVLEEATGLLQDVLMVLPEPGTQRMLLVVGAGIAHYEFLQPAAERLSDTAWRAKLASSPAPARDAFSRAYVVETRPGAAPALRADR